MRRRLAHLLALSQPVSTTHTCGNSFAASSCLGYAVTPTSYAPMSGIVSAVRVKTGNAAQGPMQIVVLRSYYQNNLQDPSIRTSSAASCRSTGRPSRRRRTPSRPSR